MQPTLFELPPPTPTVQAVQLARVRSAIGEDVLRFVRRVGVGGTFNAADLAAFVLRRHTCAPSSVDRILRDLRSSGALNYSVPSRSRSLYRVEPIA